MNTSHLNHTPPVPAWHQILPLLLSISGPLVLYLFTIPRTVVLEDDGLFLMVAKHLGIAHPPGYPLFTGIAHLFLQFPFGTDAFPRTLGQRVSRGSCVRSAVWLRSTTWGFGVGSFDWSLGIWSI